MEDLTNTCTLVYLRNRYLNSPGGTDTVTHQLAKKGYNLLQRAELRALWQDDRDEKDAYDAAWEGVQADQVKMHELVVCNPTFQLLRALHDRLVDTQNSIYQLHTSLWQFAIHEPAIPTPAQLEAIRIDLQELLADTLPVSKDILQYHLDALRDILDVIFVLDKGELEPPDRQGPPIAVVGEFPDELTTTDGEPMTWYCLNCEQTVIGSEYCECGNPAPWANRPDACNNHRSPLT